MKKVMKNKFETVAQILDATEGLSQEQINELVEIMQNPGQIADQIDNKNKYEIKDAEVRRMLNMI